MENGENVSVIVLFHNNEYFDFCVESIKRQLCANDEIIIVNDHSDAKFSPLLTRLAQDTQIKLVEPEAKVGNRAHNRNLGARVAVNEILIFVDGDIYFPEPVFPTMKDVLNEPGTAAVYGSVYGHSGNKFILDALLGFDYLECLFHPKRWEQLTSYPYLQDRRDKKEDALLNGEMSWNYLYTSYVMTRRTAFKAIDGFDEAFTRWGAEDSEFGFRLSKVGKLKYCKRLNVFHIPHDRNKHKEQLSNCKNMYYMLDKYRSLMFEFKIAYEKNAAFYSAVESFLAKMRFYAGVKHNFPLCPQTVCCHVVSQANPNGLIEFHDSNNKKGHMELVGVALPFATGRFKTAYLPHDIFLYPHTLIPRIIQEFLRVAEVVMLEPIPHSERIAWDKKIIKAFDGNSPFKDIFYSSHSLQDYKFIEENKWIRITPTFHFRRDQNELKI